MSSVAVALEQSISLFVYRCLACPIAVFGNLIIVILILKSPTMRREKFNILLVQLAAGDVILGLGLGFKALQYLVIPYGGHTTLSCTLLSTPTLLGSYVSQMTMLLIAIDRVVIVKKALVRYRSTYFYILRAMISFGVVFVATVTQFLSLDGSAHIALCSLAMAWHPTYMAIYSFTMPIVNMVVVAFYLYAIWVYKTELQGARTNVTYFYQTVISVILAYSVLSCVPKWVFAILQLANVKHDWVAYVAVSIGITEGANSILNIFVYGFSHRDIRKEIKQYLAQTAKVQPQSTSRRTQ
ncbi:hypothetical protein QR680_018875 [Steinernema hermaphroditum]|uniref:G-protein coupled receptors family 1 profile domain-containing protein n=1 Tax=Steinernema hermaphroditum TaxID=289476 RepID=A0AA39LRH5_9BILA|nr:hypothetical protein QR680_018875 [Steinernema hermaphroditum]